MKKTILLTIFCLVASVVCGQITTNEQPYGLRQKNLSIKGKTTNTLSVPDKSKIEQEDYENDKEPGPLRYAYAIHVDYDMQNSGTWYDLGDGSKIWRLNVVLPDALSTNAYYRKFWLPEGGKFFVYNEETGQSIGAITSEYIGGNKENPIEFATALVYGESVTFEYYHPASAKDLPEIAISRIDYGYRFVDNPYRISTRDFDGAGRCNININCPQGADWQNEKHAVARVSTWGPNGSFWCSCALVNNTSNDYTPYVLTADHCLSGLDAINNNNAGLWTFYWEYEHPGCTNGTEPAPRTTVGATVRANHPDSDFALLLLTQSPFDRSDVLPYYLGWDKTGSSGTGGVGIHHPDGDVKKISIYTNTPQSTGYNSNTISSNGNHWRVIWASGTTEGGSSGSPLMNNSKRIIGQLHGGKASCTSLTLPDWYGKFSVSWTGNGSSDNRRKLQPWLDPSGPGSTTVTNGSYPFTLSGPSSLVCTGTNVTFTVSSPSSVYTYTWNKSSNLTQVSISGNTAVFRVIGSGNAWVGINVNGTEVKRYTFYAGPPVESDISAYSVLYDASSRTYRATASCSKAMATKYEWMTLSPGWTIRAAEPVYAQTMHDVLITPNSSSAPSTGLAVRAYNSCGWSDWILVDRISYNSTYSISTAPNPVSSTLNVNITMNDPLREQYSSVAENLGIQQFSTTNTEFPDMIQIPTSFIIRLYSNLGTLVLQTTSQADNPNIQLDVSNLSSGIYFLQVSDDVGGEPRTSTVIVKH
jgi:hypothetical protein